jgi:hypothetical protein
LGFFTTAASCIGVGAGIALLAKVSIHSTHHMIINLQQRYLFPESKPEIEISEIKVTDDH